MRIAVIDYDSGNLASVVRAMKFVAPRADVFLARQPEVLAAADRWIFPGQGAIPQVMRSLKHNNLIPVIREYWKKKPILGICVGMQMLFEVSEEVDTHVDNTFSHDSDQHFGLGLITGEVKCLHPYLSQENAVSLKVPHMGWSIVKQNTHPMWRGIADNSRFYFAHSYFCSVPEADIAVGYTDYGIRYASAIGFSNIFAVQFHPEKSGADGLQLLKNFTDLYA